MAAGTEAPQGVLAVATAPVWRLDSLPGDCRRILVLDALQDPGNVGTIVRTATALGVCLVRAVTTRKRWRNGSGHASGGGSGSDGADDYSSSDGGSDGGGGGD